MVVNLGSEVDGAFDFDYLWPAVVWDIAYRDNTYICHYQVIRVAFVLLFQKVAGCYMEPNNI